MFVTLVRKLPAAITVLDKACRLDTFLLPNRLEAPKATPAIFLYIMDILKNVRVFLRPKTS